MSNFSPQVHAKNIARLKYSTILIITVADAL